MQVSQEQGNKEHEDPQITMTQHRIPKSPGRPVAKQIKYLGLFQYFMIENSADPNSISHFRLFLGIPTEALEGHFNLLLITYYLLLNTYHLLRITYYLSLITYYLLLIISPGRVAQSVTCLATDASLIADPGVASSIPARFHTFVEIDHVIISTVILLPSAESFKKGCCQLQVKVCARSTG